MVATHTENHPASAGHESLRPSIEIRVVSGTNIITIEVHQNSTTSSDLAMNVDLAGMLLVPRGSAAGFSEKLIQVLSSAPPRPKLAGVL